MKRDNPVGDLPLQFAEGPLALRDASLLRRHALVDGKWVNGRTARTYTVSNPANGVVLAELPDMDAEDTRVAIEAAKSRGEAIDHVLLFGPPGVGKTSLAHVVAHELAVPIKTTSGPVVERAGDLAALLTAMEDREVLFVDEIHRMDAKVEEILYPALEDFELDLMIGSGPGARSMRVPLKPFTLIAATTRAGLLKQ